MTTITERTADVTPTIVVTQPTPITLTACRRALALTFCVTAFWIVGACISHSIWIKLSYATLSVGYTVQTAQWVKKYRTIRRDGPIIPAPVKSVVITGAAAKAIVALSYFVMAALTFVALAWSAMSLMILVHFHSPIAFAAILATNVFVWWFATAVWKRSLSEKSRPNMAASSVQGGFAVTSNDHIEPDAAQTSASSPIRWWTSNAVRDEIQQNVGR